MSHTLENMGNLITAAIPVNLRKYSEEATLGDKIVFSIQGSGLSISHSGLIWPDLTN